MTGRTLTVRALAMLGAGSAAIHQVRYAIGYGDAAPHALAAHPHAYLAVASPALMTIAIVALASGIMRIARRERGRTASARVPLLVLWLAATLALAAIYGTQETIEGAGAIAGGGWIGLLLAVPAGLLVALFLRGADAAEALTAMRLPHAFDLRIGFGRTLYQPFAPSLAPADPFGARGPPPVSVV